jgi:hypothetical protein
MPFLPTPDISNLFELFFPTFSAYPYAPCAMPSHHPLLPPICLFYPPQIFQICLNYFFPTFSAYPYAPCAIPSHHPLLPPICLFLPTPDISNLSIPTPILAAHWLFGGALIRPSAKIVRLIGDCNALCSLGRSDFNVPACVLVRS